jgi:hypothetical protein
MPINILGILVALLPARPYSFQQLSRLRQRPKQSVLLLVRSAQG